MNSGDTPSKNPYEDFDWRVHVIGPDDIHQCDSFRTAVHLAAEINACALDVIESGKVTEHHPVLFATVERVERSAP